MYTCLCNVGFFHDYRDITNSKPVSRLREDSENYGEILALLHKATMKSNSGLQEFTQKVNACVLDAPLYAQMYFLGHHVPIYSTTGTWNNRFPNLWSCYNYTKLFSELS